MDEHESKPLSMAEIGVEEFFAAIEAKFPGRFLRSVLQFDTEAGAYISVDVRGDQILLDLNPEGCRAVAGLCDQFVVLEDHRDHVHTYPGAPLANWSFGLTFESHEGLPDFGAPENGSIQCDFMQDELFVSADCAGYANLAELLRDLETGGTDQSSIRLRPGYELVEESFECVVRLVSITWDEYRSSLPAGADDVITFREMQRQFRPVRDELYARHGISL